MSKPKTRVVGTESYINSTTGELVEMNVIESVENEKDFNFHKMFMRDFISAIDLVGNRKTKVCYWIIEHLNKDNMLLYTYRDIHEATGISLDTIQKTVTALKNADFLRKKGPCLMVNPDIIFKGSHARRCNVLHTYATAEKEPESPESIQARISNIQNTIAGLQKQITTLQTKSNLASNTASKAESDSQGATEQSEGDAVGQPLTDAEAS